MAPSSRRAERLSNLPRWPHAERDGRDR
jgi:hypothetical protein